MIDFNQLSDEQIDQLLERFDQTEPGLQRRIIAKFVAKAVNLTDVCKELLEWAKSTEWTGDNSSIGPTCLSCGAFYRRGHKDGCRYVAMLGEAQAVLGERQPKA